MHHVALEGFPDDVRFNAHGIYLEKESSTLYVLNHAYKHGGDRVEVFHISDQDNNVAASYMRSVKLSEDVLGILNDLTVVGDYIYLTQSLPFPDTMEGREDSFSANMKRMLMLIFMKTGNIHKCKNTRAASQTEEQAECEIEAKGVIGFGNGITTNGSTKLWAVDDQTKEIIEFDVEQTNGSLKEHSRIKMDSLIDNLHYEPDTGNIMAATIARAIDFNNFVDAVKSGKDTSGIPIPSGVSYLKFKDGVFEQREDLLLQDKVSSVSIAVPWRG